MQRKEPPVRANTLTQFEHPGFPVQEKVAARQGEPAYAVRAPRLSGAGKSCRPDRVNRLRGSSAPLSRCRKRSRPVRANTLTQFVCPGQPVQKKSRPVRANTLTQFVCPGQPVLKNCRPVRANTLTQFVCPGQPVQKRSRAEGSAGKGAALSQ